MEDVDRLRPAIVVSTGAGVAVPFFLVAKLRGAKTAYIEVFDRIDSVDPHRQALLPVERRVRAAMAGAA